MKRRRAMPAARRDARGFSLVELMVAVTLGLLLIAAVSAIFVGTRHSYTVTTGNSGAADSVRFSSDFMNRSLRSTGFIGCTGGPIPTSGVQSSSRVIVNGNQVGTGANVPMSVLFDFGNIVAGYEAGSTSPGSSIQLAAPAGDTTVTDWTLKAGSGATVYNLPNDFSFVPPSGTATTTGLQGQVVKGSDVLVVYSTTASTNFPVTVTGAVAAGAATVPVSSTAGLAIGGIYAISDCANATVFQATGLAATSISVAAAGSAGSGTVLGNTQQGFFNQYGAAAMIYQPTTSIYYIGVGADGDSALYRADLTATITGTGLAATATYAVNAYEIAPDVENMQILYGVDTTGARSATTYVTANNVPPQCNSQYLTTPNPSFNCVVSVSVAFLVASAPGTVATPASLPTYTLLGTSVQPVAKDTRQRTVYQITVALRNAMP